VILPTYNRREILVTALASALGRIGDEDEVIVVDDGSTDGTGDDLRQAHDPRVRTVRIENSGPAAARNAGIGIATGRYFAFLDSDDEWFPTGLTEQVAALEADHAVGLSHAGALNEFLNGDAAPPRPRPPHEGRVLAPLLRRNFITTSTAVVPRRVTDEVGLFDESLERSMDWDLWLRIADRHRFHYRPGVVALYRFHEGQQIRDRESVDDCRRRILTKALDRLEARDDALAPLARRCLVYRLLRLGRLRLREGNRAAARESFAVAARLSPRSRLTAWRYRVTIR